MLLKTTAMPDCLKKTQKLKVHQVWNCIYKVIDGQRRSNNCGLAQVLLSLLRFLDGPFRNSNNLHLCFLHTQMGELWSGLFKAFLSFIRTNTVRDRQEMRVSVDFYNKNDYQ